MATFKNNVSQGFGLGVGFGLANIIFSMGTLFVGMAFFIPGFIMVLTERKKPKDKQRTWFTVLGYILMALGVITGLGFGGFSLLGLLGDEF
jgi:hypothetical protein